ncbi:MAG: L-threonylcarbamoyladenylate synthase [Flavobacteriaceae bacterium]|nr:L-threonylcarbamoyladenylate synthase [Flavobacteriaceae bacterium]
MITSDLNQVKTALINGDIIALPTETVYGLAANIYLDSALEKVFKLKKRPSYNPLIVHISNSGILEQIAKNIPAKARELANVFWPGPLTLVLEKQDQIPNRITAGKPTVAVRVPNHPIALQLLKSLNFPLAAPSANPFGSLSPTSAKHVALYFKDEINFILDGGPCFCGLESTIIGFENDKPILYRHGAISIEEIEKIVGPIKIKNQNSKNPSAPGMLTRHYAPKTQIQINDDISLALAQNPDKKIGVLSFRKNKKIKTEIHQEVLSISGDLNEASKNLYAALHRLDQMNLDLIISSFFPEKGLGKTINDRLKRAIK